MRNAYLSNVFNATWARRAFECRQFKLHHAGVYSACSPPCVETFICACQSFFNVVASPPFQVTCQKYLIKCFSITTTVGKLCTCHSVLMHDKKTSTTNMPAIGATRDPQRSCPTPRCHVCAWSGHAWRGPRPGTWLRAETARKGSGPGRSALHSAFASVRHHSCITQGLQSTCSQHRLHSSWALPLHRWQIRFDVKPVKSRWHLPKTCEKLTLACMHF